MRESIEFKLPNAAYETVAWTHNEHFPGSETPLMQDTSLMAPGVSRGDIPRRLFVNGYSYSQGQGQGFESSSNVDIFAGSLETWKDRWLAKIALACAQLEQFNADAAGAGGWPEAIDAHAANMRTTFVPLHMETMGIALPAAYRFVEGWNALMGRDDTDRARSLLQGFPNESSARRRQIWELGQLARRHDELKAAVLAGRLPDGESAAAREFRGRMTVLLERFGDTLTMHLQDLPSWAEDPSRPLAMVAAFMEDSTDPTEADARQASNRKAEEANLRAMAETNSEAAELLRILPIAQHLPSVSEDHNVLGDHRLLAASRRGWLNIGGHLVANGRLRDREDIFYLYKSELLEQLAGTCGPFDEAVIAERRARQAAWRSVSPPGQLGTARSAATGGSSVRGVPGSGGTYTGRARVVPSLDDAAVLRPGDILVVAAAGPEWSAYFGLIGALVTDIGGALTHAAVVAREFGIPAVVNARTATQLIPDGATITVNGGTGEVTLH